jgi:hypothetical protein
MPYRCGKCDGNPTQYSAYPLAGIEIREDQWPVVGTPC